MVNKVIFKISLYIVLLSVKGFHTVRQRIRLRLKQEQIQEGIPHQMWITHMLVNLFGWSVDDDNNAIIIITDSKGRVKFSQVFVCLQSAS